jgi:hypothetical protein
MRIAIKEETVYSYDELSERAKQTALENLWQINTDYEWGDYIFDDAKECAKLIGIDIDDIFFSGFSSQGDGAQFTGRYEYAPDGAKAIREHAPQDQELHKIADALQLIQRRHFYKLSASVSSSGRYSHEYCTDITVYDEHGADGLYVDAETDETVTDLLRDFMRWIYSRLETEYEWQTSREVIEESIRANEYEFTADGELY